MKRFCLICGKEFETFTHNMCFCSNECVEKEKDCRGIKPDNRCRVCEKSIDDEDKYYTTLENGNVVCSHITCWYEKLKNNENKMKSELLYIKQKSEIAHKKLDLLIKERTFLEQKYSDVLVERAL